jgi:hypothetical protein
MAAPCRFVSRDRCIARSACGVPEPFDTSKKLQNQHVARKLERKLLRS